MRYFRTPLKERRASRPSIYKVLKSMYVYDLNSGSSNVTEGYELYQKTKSIMLKAGMNVTKWPTNSLELIKMIEENELVVSPEPVSITHDPRVIQTLLQSILLFQVKQLGKF